MTRKTLSLLFLITCHSISVSGSNYLSYVAGGRKYRTHARTRSMPTEFFLYCQIEPGCVCNREGNGYVFHCEEEVHARMSPIDEKGGKLDLKCNETLPSEGLLHDYHLTMGLDGLEEVRVHMTGCPEPPDSYALLFTPSSSLLAGSDQIERNSSIRVLVIDCSLREQFTLRREHFIGLNGLEFLEIACASLHSLPEDLFQGKFPNLLSLNITNTAIESIPDGLLSSLPNLQTLRLVSNRIEGIRNGNLRDAASLINLFIHEPQLTSLEDDVFNYAPNLKRFSLENSSIAVLPKSLGKLANLEIIALFGNKIEDIEIYHCAMWEKMRELQIERNPLLRVDFDCIFNFKNLSSINIIGTSLSNLPDKPMTLNKLRKLVFNKNTISISRASRFIVSETLVELEMVGSNIKSFDHDFLHSSPNLKVIDLSNNGFSVLHEDFFSHNPNLLIVIMTNNNLTMIPPNVFRSNSELSSLLLTNNAISDLSSSLFSNCRSLINLNLGGNNLRELPNKFISNLDKLLRFSISNNKISTLEHDCFAGLTSLNTLDLSNNILSDSNMTCFRELANSKTLFTLNLYGNAFTFNPPLHIISLKLLNFSNNKLQFIEDKNFRLDSQLIILDLSRNALETLSKSVYRSFGRLNILDLSFNLLTEIPDRALSSAIALKKLRISGNKIRKFNVCVIGGNRNIEELDLSGNELHSIGDYSSNCYGEITSLKVLNLANNQLTFNDSNWIYDKDRRTWGNISPLIYFPNIEEIILTNNSISAIFLDWRNMLVKLRILDLRHNKIKYLTHQDLLYPTTILTTDGLRTPVTCSHSLQVDLRHNLIIGMELPKNMLVKRRRGERFANVTLMLEDNPFNCGCGVINVLRLFDGDIVLTSELRRTEGLNWISPAKIEPGNLSCWSVQKLLSLTLDIFCDGTLIPTVRPLYGPEGQLLLKMSKHLPRMKCSEEFNEIEIASPLVFHGVRVEEARLTDSPSWYNPMEAVQCLEYMKILYHLAELSPSDIGIITPYVEQVKTIKNLTGDNCLPLPKVGTVEEFQGQERLVILLSCVRASQSQIAVDLIHALGFVSSSNRMKVATSRARALLIILGDPHLLQHDPLVNKVIITCLEKSHTLDVICQTHFLIGQYDETETAEESPHDI